MADVHTGGGSRPGLEEVVRETAGGGPEVQDVEPIHGDGEFFEVTFEFFRPAADVFGRGFEGDWEVGRVGFARFVQDGGPGADFARQDEGLGDVAGLAKALFHEELVEPCFRGFHKYG